nr:reverse transcriptase domain-containing protein [Tanacetum cinerariifolium]
GLSGDDANKHLDKFLHVTQSIKVNGVTDDSFRLYLFPHSLTNHATTWFDRLPRNSINTFEKMAKMFLGKYFPPSMVMKLRNEITNFRQRPNESLFEAWERYKISIDRCINHNMLPVTQIDTFYNELTLRYRDTINAAAGGTFMKRCPEECYDLIKNMTAHHNDWDTSAQQSESYSSITSSFDPEIVALKDEMAEINKNLMKVLQINQQVKAVTPNCETCGGPHYYNDFPATIGQTQTVYAAGAYQCGINETIMVFLRGTTKEETNSSKELVMVQTRLLLINPQVTKHRFINPRFLNRSGTLPSNTVTNPKEDLKGITTQSGTAYQGPTIPTTSSSLPQVVECKIEVTKDSVPPINNGSTKDVQPSVVQVEILVPNSEPVVAPLARALLNEQCSAILLKKLPKKLGDPGKFLIPCDFPRMEECLALANLGASINLMPLSVWNKLSLLELTPTLMTLELADRSISRSISVAEDVYVKVGKFHFPTDFVVVDFDADPRIPLILRRSFLKTRRALIDVYTEYLTLRVNNEAVTFNLDQTSRYSANYNDMTTNRFDVIDMAYEEYSKEVLSFSDVIVSGNPTPYYDPIISTSSPTLTPFGDSDFLLEEVDAFLALEDDPTSPEVDHSYYDLEGDILLLEEFLNDDPSLPPPNQGMYFPQVRSELKICEAKNDKSSIDEPPEVELKDLPPHLEYSFLEGDDKLPVIITKDLSVEEKAALIKVLKSHKQAIAWKLSDIKGIDPEFCTHTILMEDNFEPTVHHQRRVNPKIYDVIKKEVYDGYLSRYDRKTMEVFMDDFLVFGNSFGTCLSHFEKMLKRCEDTNLCLNWEKSHFMVKEGIALGHKISKNGIEVDKAKVVVIAKLPHPTTVKGIRSFLGHAGFYRRFIQDFSKIARPMTHLLEKDTLFFSKVCVEAFKHSRKN